MFSTGSLPPSSRSLSKFAQYHHRPLSLFLITVTTLIAMAFFGWGSLAVKRFSGNQTAVTVVSAASFEITPVAPESIVAAFGTGLATRVEIANVVPLPTTLAGTTLRIIDSAGVERLAPLFFVSPGQINCQIPAGTAPGEAMIIVTSGDGIVSMGKVQIVTASPSLFTANASGQGVAAGFGLRVKADGTQEPVNILRFDSAMSRFVTVPIDPGPASDQIYLVLFGTGIRGRVNLTDVEARIGGVKADVLYAGPQGDFIGLDQINLLLPHSLDGRGRVNLALAVKGFSASNLAEIEVGLPEGASKPTVNGYNLSSALASQTLTINGAGFSVNTADMLVRIAGIEGRIITAAPTQISAQIPFGARSGPVSVRTPLGEGIGPHLPVRTSISGIVETATRQPLSGAKVSLANTTITTTTNNEGAFLLADAPAGLGIVEIDGGTVSAALPFPKVQFKLRVNKDQDNAIERPVSLQQITGATITVGGSSLNESTVSIPFPAEMAEPADTIQSGNVTFEIPAGTTVRFPDGRTSGTLTLTLVEKSRTPVNLPSSIFSSAIVQISPFGAVLTPGGKLTFPNSDGFPAGSPARLFRLDQTPNSPTLGSFIDAGAATVSADGQRIETATDAVKETSYYFVANAQPTTTVAGRVVDADGITPVRQAVVRVRGQEVFTDGNGGFVLRNVPVKPANDTLSVEASFVRPTGRVDRVQRDNIAVVVNGVTAVTPDLVLPAEADNRPPVIVPPPTSVTVNAGQTVNFNFTAYDPDPGQTIRVELIGAPPWVTIIPGSGNSYTLRLAPPAGISGNFPPFMLKATDNQGASTIENISVRVSPTAIACGQVVSGGTSSRVQRDTFIFNGKTNDAVILTAKATGGAGFCVVAEVISPSGANVKTLNCNTTSRFTLPSDGTYTILLYDEDLNQTGTYDMNLQFSDGRCAIATTGCGEIKSGSTRSRTEHQIYKFNGKTNEAVILTAKATGGAGFCVVAEVISPSGVLVKTLNCNTTSRFTLPSDGTYTILLYDEDLNQTGTYDMNLQFSDGRCAIATLIYGQTRSGSTRSRTEHQIYKFNGKTNDAVILTAKATGGAGFCVVAEVNSPSGVNVKTNTCNTEGRFSLPSDGTYTILLYDEDLNQTGTYDINLTCIGPTCVSFVPSDQQFPPRLNQRKRRNLHPSP